MPSPSTPITFEPHQCFEQDVIVCNPGFTVGRSPRSPPFTELLEQLRCAHVQETALLQARIDQLQRGGGGDHASELLVTPRELIARQAHVAADRLCVSPRLEMLQMNSGDNAIDEEPFGVDAPFEEGAPQTKMSGSSYGMQLADQASVSKKVQAGSSLNLPFEKKKRKKKDVPAYDGSFKSRWIVYRRHASKIADGPWWEACWAGVILLNAVVMACETQYAGLQVARDLGYDGLSGTLSDTPNEVFTACEYIFGFAFCFEAIFKMSALSWKYFIDVWNLLDLLTVLLFLVEAWFKSLLPFNTHTLRLLRICRLVRLLRLLRDLEAFDALHLMTTAIKSSSSIFLWSVALLLFFQMTAALFMAQVLHSTYFEAGNQNDPKIELEIFSYFGTFTRATLTMFELAVANWTPVTRLLCENLTEWFAVLCLGHKLTVGFAVIGIINGVFMQETFKIASTDDNLMVRNKSKSVRTHENKMAVLFNSLNQSHDGRLTLEEFQTIAAHSKVRTWLASMDIHTDDIDTLFWLLDDDQDGSITLHEFITGTARLKGNARSIDMATLVKKAVSLQHAHRPHAHRPHLVFGSTHTGNSIHDRLVPKPLLQGHAQTEPMNVESSLDDAPTPNHMQVHAQTVPLNV